MWYRLLLLATLLNLSLASTGRAEIPDRQLKIAEDEWFVSAELINAEVDAATDSIELITARANLDDLIARGLRSHLIGPCSIAAPDTPRSLREYIYRHGSTFVGEVMDVQPGLIVGPCRLGHCRRQVASIVEIELQKVVSSGDRALVPGDTVFVQHLSGSFTYRGEQFSQPVQRLNEPPRPGDVLLFTIRSGDHGVLSGPIAPIIGGTIHANEYVIPGVSEVPVNAIVEDEPR